MAPSADVRFSSELWPGGLTAGQVGVRTYLCLRRSGAVRTLVPAESPVIVGKVIASSNAPQSRGRSMARTAAGVVAAATLRRIPAAGTRWAVGTAEEQLEDQLARIVGLERVVVSVHLGPERANQKPVIKVYDEPGDLRAVAKLGSAPLTRRLVADEAAALESLATRPHAELLIPSLLHYETRGDLSLLVQSVVPQGGRHRLPTPSRRIAAERAVIDAGVPVRAALRDQRYADDLAGRLHDLPEDATSQAMASSGQGLLDLLADRVILSGGWHGDWSPQNICAVGSRTGAWDWERWAVDRPAGFDALHFRIQTLLGEKGHRDDAGRHLLAEAPTILAPHQPGVDADSARLLAGLYLAEVGHRYLTDRQRDTSSSAGLLDTWLMPPLISVARQGLDKQGRR